MAIRHFAVGPLRGLERAEASGLGNLVVLAGPNGAGKSSLLDLLRQQRAQWAEPGTKVMFVGPHRTWRSSSLNKVSIYGYPMSSYGALLESDNLPNFQYVVPPGMQGLQGMHRESGSADDAPAFVKTSLGRRVFGIVDADSDNAPDDEHVIAWPVAMVENFLLDPQAIYAVLQPFGPQTGALSATVVLEALDQAVQGRVEDEVRLRVQRQLPIGRLTLRPDEAQNAADIAKAESARWLAKLESLDIPALTEAARAEVNGIISTGQQLNRFHGKKILHAVYTSLRVADAGLGKTAFALSLAANDFARERAGELAGPAIQRIRLFFPAALPDVFVGLVTKRSANS